MMMVMMTDAMMTDAMELNVTTTTTTSLQLSEEETAWLEENDTIRVVFDPDWYPIEYANDEGNLKGISLQYMDEFSRLTGANFTAVSAPDNWNDALAMIRNGDADIMYMVANTSDRLEYMNFTTTHYTLETKIVTSTNEQTTLDDDELTFLTIDGYAIEDWLDENYPDLEYKSVTSFLDGVALMKSNSQYAFVATLPVVTHHASNVGLQVYDAGLTGHEYGLTVGYTNQQPILGSILQKVVDAIPESQIEAWWSVTSE